MILGCTCLHTWIERGAPAGSQLRGRQLGGSRAALTPSWDELVNTITGRIVVAAGVSFVVALLILGVSAPLLAQDHDAQALEAWLTSEANVVGDLGAMVFKPRIRPCLIRWRIARIQARVT